MYPVSGSTSFSEASSTFFALAAWAVSALFLSLETSRPLWIVIGLAFVYRSLVGAHRTPAEPA